MNRAAVTRFAALNAAVAVMLPLASACHSGGGGSTAGSTGLDSALASVADTRASRASFEWANIARIRDLGGITQQQAGGLDDTDHRRWAPLFSTGTGEFNISASQLTDTIDLFTARSAMQIGNLPTTVVRIDGVDIGKARAGLVRLGGKPGTVAGHDGVILAADYVIHRSGRLPDLGLFDINKIAFDGDRVVFGPAEAPVADALAGGPRLRDDQSVAETGRCLGDVLTADIMPASTATPASGAQTVGLGVRNPVHATDPVTEDLCLTAADKGAADVLEQRVRQHATLTADSYEALPWADLVSAITISRPTDRTIRIELTDRADRAASLLLDALNHEGGIASLIG
jgi:hypothetical protein